jgi:hypothetical protein
VDFEYRRPDVEGALAAAVTFDELEAALQQVLRLMSDLGKPDVYGWKLFARGLDATVPAIARKLGLADRLGAPGNDNVCIVATQLYARGGHSKVASDISALIGADRTVAVLTDAYGRLSQRQLIGAQGAESPLRRRADVLLAGRTLVEKIVELYNILAAVRPTRIFMLTHHFDIVAAVALWPFRDVVEFLHHADHVPAVGATLPWRAHVDLTWTCHRACREAGLEATYAGMTVRLGGGDGEARSPRPARLRIATCGPAAKYSGRATYDWIDFAAAALRAPEAEVLHIGPAEEAFRTQIRSALSARGVDPERYVFEGEVADLAQALTGLGAQAYVSSYPVPGGKANLEAMALGLATFVPVDPASPPLLQFDFPATGWTRVITPEELSAGLSRGDFGEPEQRTRAAAAREQLELFERHVQRP